MAVTRQIPLGAAERVPNACAWTNSTREESFEPLVAHYLRLDTSSGPALRLLRTHTARVLTTQMPETRRLRLPRLHTCLQTCPVDHSEIGKARIRISVLPQRQKAHSACCEATPSCGIKVHSAEGDPSVTRPTYETMTRRSGEYRGRSLGPRANPRPRQAAPTPPQPEEAHRPSGERVALKGDPSEGRGRSLRHTADVRYNDPAIRRVPAPPSGTQPPQPASARLG